MKKLLLLPFLVCFVFAQAQDETDTTRYNEVRSMVNFYKYMLNTVGSDQTPTRDKEVIITESYKKIFVGSTVQIEDDLSADRKVITNKDVTAYLRDVDFFFKTIRFDFEDISINKMAREDSSYYFLVSFESILEGVTLDETNYSNAKKRFMEINLSDVDQDLKIASVYSTKVSREMELANWWESLSVGWKDVFSSLVPHDSISTAILLNMAAIDSIQIAEYHLITDIEPLNALKQLTYLDISLSQIRDINALRHAGKLKSIKASFTPVSNLAALQFCRELTSLEIAGTDLDHINDIAGLSELTHLNLAGAAVKDFSALKHLNNLSTINLSNTGFDDPTLLANCLKLEEVNLSRTSVDHLFVFQSLPNVRILDLSESKIVNLNGLENHPSLQVLNLNQTSVNNLNQLKGAPKLRKVYADLSGISEEVAATFMQNNPGSVVITNSAQLSKWWQSLDKPWKLALVPYLKDIEPGKEDLVKLINIDSLDVSGQKLYTSSPLLRFKRLKYLNVSGLDLTQFDFTGEMSELEVLRANHTPITNTKGLESNTKLREIEVTGSKLNDISDLSRLHKLSLLKADDTPLSQSQIVEHLNINLSTVIIYQSEQLRKWWQVLDTSWKNAFELADPNDFELHQLIERTEISIANQPIADFTPLHAFINLKSIILDRTRATNLNDLLVHQELESLTLTNGPLQNLDGIDRFRKLKLLNISNTAIEDLKDLYYAQSLTDLNCSGTGIKNLKGLDKLINIENLDVSNTRIWRLERLHGMSRIQTLTCYNTRLSQAKVDAFLELFPECEVTFY